jgi:hypothetical protein
MCTNTVKRYSTVKDQFYYNDVTKKHHCKICEKGYKTFSYKNGNINRHMLAHFRTTCIPVEEQRTRNHTEANKAETDCEAHLRQLYPGCTITTDKRTLMVSEFPKADRILNGKDRIQVKKTPYERIHNWIKTTHIQHAKNVWDIKDMTQRLTDIVSQDERNIYNRLIKYRRRPGKSRAIINFIAFTVSIKSDRDYRKVPEYTKITDLNTKKMFLHWDKNEKNNFYHMYGTDMNNVIQLTDEVIEKMNIVYDVRAIYNTSGPHNNGFENIFRNDTDINDMISRVNIK